MKPASIISLIIAVLLVVIGLVTCFIAQNMANTNGEFLFDEEIDGNYRKDEDLTETELSKIELIADDVTINIYGRSDKSHVEFINFKQNYYSLSTTNRILSFDEIPDIKSMLKFWENGFSFNGMRYILNFNHRVDETREKVINVYLTSDKEIKLFNIQANNAIINIEAMTTATDYNITGDNITVNASTMKTSSSMNINTSSGAETADLVSLNFSTAFINNLNVNANELNMDAKTFRCSGECNIKSNTGTINITTVKKPEEINLTITTDGGITVDGTPQTSTYVNSAGEDAGNIVIDSVMASVTISKITSNEATFTDTESDTTAEAAEAE